MPQNWKPSDHSVLAPYLMVNNAPKIAEFLENLFDGKRLRFQYRDDGSIMHAEIKIGDSVVMLSEATKDWPAFPTWMHVYVEDVEKTYKKALELGATSAQEPAGGKGNGDIDQRGGVKDSSGNIWWIATQRG